MRAMFAAFLLFFVITPAEAQETPITPPILWLADQLDTGEYQIDGNFQIYTWDGTQAVNVSQYRGYCDTIYPFSDTVSLFRCEGDLFAWDGQHTRLITNERTALHPAISADGRMAWWAYSPEGEYTFEVAVWDDEHVEYVSGQYGWRGGAYWTADGGEDSPRWSPDGERLAWFSSQDGGETFGVYVWDGEQVITVADGLAWVHRLTWTRAGSLFWTAEGDNPLDRIRSLWDGQQNIRLGDFDETAIIGSEVLGTGDQIAWVLTTNRGAEVVAFDGSETRIVSENPVEHIRDVSWLGDGRLIWAADGAGEGRLYLWDGANTRRILPEIGAVQEIKVSNTRDEVLITAVRDGEGTFYVWDLAQLIPLASTSSSDSSARWTANGDIQLSLNEVPNRKLWYWDHHALTLISDMPGLRSYGAIWSENGAAVFDTVLDTPCQIYLWNEGQITLLLDGWILLWAEWRGDLLFIQASDVANPYEQYSEIFLWDGTSIVNISQSPTYDGFYDPFGMG